MRIFTTSLLVVLQLSLAAQAPDIHASRPRMLCDSTRIAWMQANMLQPGDFGDTYTLFDNRYNNWWINDPQLYLLGSDSTLWTWDWNSNWATDEAVYSVVLYRLNQDPLQLKRCRFLAQQVIDRIQGSDFPNLAWFDAEDIHRQMSATGILLLDWCYDDLPTALRQELAQALYSQSRAFMSRFIQSAAGTSFVSSHNTWNHVYANQNALVLHGADGLTTAQQDTVLQWHELVYNRWMFDFFPVYQHYRSNTGGWNWGAAYSMWSLIDQFQLFDNMLIATGTNWYVDQSWVHESINQYIYFIQPDGKSIQLGDGITTIYGDRVVYRHASLFQDPRSMWMAQEYAQAQYLGNTNPVFQKLVYKDFTLPTVAFPSPPLDWWSGTVGLNVSRSSWEEDATMVSYFCSPSKRAAHEHRDNNSFAVFKNTPLLLDAGYYDTYGGTHMLNYYSRSIAHNTILVYDSTEQMTSLGSAASNDGGQIDSPALQNIGDIFLPQNQRGNWELAATGDGYQLNITDADLSYAPAKLDRFRRRLLFLKPDRMIVLDHVHLLGVGSQQRDVQWLAHFAQTPTMSGTLTSTEVAGHIETYDGTDHVSVNGTGSIALRTLLPANSSTTRVGGTGYEYWVDGANHPPIVTVDTNYYTPGSWRIEVRPQTVTDSVIFLHTIRTGTNTAPAQPGGSALVNSTTLAVDWNDTLALFSTDGGTDRTQHLVNVLLGGRVIQLVATDLAFGHYCIWIDGVHVLDGYTDGNGLLSLPMALSIGTHTLELADCLTGAEDIITADGSLRAYPLPAIDQLHVWNGLSERVAAELLDASGRVIQQMVLRPGANSMAVGHVTAGAYILRTASGVSVRVMIQ